MKIDDRMSITEYAPEIARIISQGGPKVADYEILNQYLDIIENSVSTDPFEIEKISGENFLQSNKSILGHIRNRPYGYAGDFKIIDRIYTSDISTDFAHWDNYALNQEGAKAVINRKSYFIKLVTEKFSDGPVTLLNIASGPARDMKELYDGLGKDEMLISDCVEIDSNAIAYATHLCNDHLSNITFLKNNIFRFQTTKKYDLIWSAGLFDYLGDREFIIILKNLLKNLNVGGEIVIGNFSNENPSRNFMEILGDWYLNHRSPKDLIDLALNAGATTEQIWVDKEPLGINLFLHISGK